MTENNDTIEHLDNKKHKKTLLKATSVMFFFGLLGGLYWFTYGQYFESTDNAYLHGDVTSISPKVSGFISKSYISDNQFVKQGDLLIEIDGRDYQTALDQANAHITVVRASVQNLVAKQTLQHSLIKQAQSRVDSAQADYELSLQQIDRFRSLLKKKYTSQDEVDGIQAKQKIALAQLEEEKANLAASNDQLIMISSEIKQAKASVTEAQAEQKQARLNLEYTHIYSPVNGIIGKRNAQEGALIQAGTPLLSIVPSSDIWVEANFKETQLSGILKGQVVTISLDAYPDQEIKGVVDSFSPATGAEFALLPPENATGNFTKIVQRVPVKITIPDQKKLQGRLLPGLSATVTIDLRG